MENQISQRITEILINKLGLTESVITEDANFIKDLGIDSIDYAELIMEFEKAFDIRIPYSEAQNITTIQQALDYIEGKLQAK